MERNEGEKEKKQAVFLGERLLSFPTFTLSHFHFLTFCESEFHTNEGGKEKKQSVYLGERLFSFPSDRLGRLQDHTGKHRYVRTLS